MSIHTTTTLADLATTRPGATRVFHRHGLDFCCAGRRPLADACADRGLDAEAVIAEIEAADPAAAPGRRWDLAPLSELIAFIVGTYHHRLRETLPELIRLAAKVESRHAGKDACPSGLAAHLETMRRGVLEHLEKEEGVLFPMVLAGRGREAGGPVHVMELEHDEHARNLQVVRRLTGNLRVPDEACPTWRALYAGLEQLEEELMEHVHLENHVLFRRALVE